MGLIQTETVSGILTRFIVHFFGSLITSFVPTLPEIPTPYVSVWALSFKRYSILFCFVKAIRDSIQSFGCWILQILYSLFSLSTTNRQYRPGVGDRYFPSFNS